MTTVLYVNHTGRVSGGERSLLDLLRGLPGTVRPVVACPPGQLDELLRRSGVPVTRIPGTDASLKLHPRYTPQAALELAAATVAVAAAARREGASIIHANSIRAGIVACAARRLAGRPVVVHVRDRLPASRIAGASLRLATGGADLVIANSSWTAEAVPPGRGDRVRVLANPFDLSAFDPRAHDPAAVRAQLGLPPAAPVLAVVAQVTPWKAQDDAVRALGRLHERGLPAHLLIVGDTKFDSAATRHDNKSFVASLEREVLELGLGEHVHWLGERDDVPAILSALDLLLVPSWEEPFGRTVIEGMAMGLPVLATRIGGPAEILRDGVDGVLLPPRDPESWADAAERLLRDPQQRRRMGEAGRARAHSTYALPRHVEGVLGFYAGLAR